MAQRLSKRAESDDNPWRIPPVDVETFTREFLGREHSQPQLHFLKTVIGEHTEWQPDYRIFACCVGMGGGKNFTVESYVCYEDYRLLCLKNPQKFFWGLNEHRFVDILNFSFVNETQAKEVFFDSVKNVIRSCRNPDTGGNWFEEQGVDIRDRGIGDIQSKIIKLPRGIRNRCIVATREGFQGSNILVGIFDEPSRAVPSPPKNELCHQLFADVQSNTETRFGSQGKVIAFSYPEAQDDDLIIELVDAAQQQREAYEKGEGRKPTIFAVRHATYEFNPLRSKEDFEDQRLADPEGYETRIECNPPKSKTGFYRDYPELVIQQFNRKMQPCIVYEIYPLTRQVPQVDGTLYEQTYTAIRLVEARGDRKYRALGGDPGLSGDGFALAMGYAVPMERAIRLMADREYETPATDLTGRVVRQQVTPDGGVEPVVETVQTQKELKTVTINRRPIIDMLVRIKPIRQRVGKAYQTFPVDFISVKDFILQLKQHFPNLTAAGFDRWNSASLIQELVRARIIAKDRPFTNAEQMRLYRQHRALAWNSEIEIVWQPEDAGEAALAEFENLQLINNTKIDHKTGDNTPGKDMTDGIVICVDEILQIERKPRGMIFY